MMTVWRWIALAAFLVFVIATAGVVLSSQPTVEQSNQPAAAENPAKSQSQQNNKTLWDSWFPEPIALYTLVLTFFTAILAFGGLYQLTMLGRAEVISAQTAKAAKDQAKAAADANTAATKALQQSQRPWVVAASLGFARSTTFTDDRYEMQLNLMLRNTGNSVATDVFTVMRLEENLVKTLETNWNKTDEDLRDKKENVIKQSKWPLGIVLAPGQYAPQPFGFGGPTGKPGSPSAERIKSRAYYFLGLIEYKDQFGLTHRTRFAFNPDPWGSGDFVVSGGMQEAD